MSTDEALNFSWEPRTYAIAPDFGDIEDFFPENEITPERSAAWDRSRDTWEEAIERALDAADERDLDGCRDALADARRAEEEWGDWPETRRIRDALALPENNEERERAPLDGDDVDPYDQLGDAGPRLTVEQPEEDM